MFNIPPNFKEEAKEKLRKSAGSDRDITAASAHELIAAKHSRDHEDLPDTSTKRQSTTFKEKGPTDAERSEPEKSEEHSVSAQAEKDRSPQQKSADGGVAESSSPNTGAAPESFGLTPPSAEAEQKIVALPEAPKSETKLTREEEIEEALNCPCIDAMREGPCGNDFIAAYRCFLESDTEPKGMDCVDKFATMQTCMAEHPEEYNLDDDEKPLQVDDAAGVSGSDSFQTVESADEKVTVSEKTNRSEAVPSTNDSSAIA